MVVSRAGAHSRSAAFSLTELLLALALALTVLGVALSSLIGTLKVSDYVRNRTDQSLKAVIAGKRLSQDVRDASAVIAINSNQCILRGPGWEITYSFEQASRRVLRTANGQSTLLLSDCFGLIFQYCSDLRDPLTLMPLASSVRTNRALGATVILCNSRTYPPRTNTFLIPVTALFLVLDVVHLLIRKHTLDDSERNLSIALAAHQQQRSHFAYLSNSIAQYESKLVRKDCTLWLVRLLELSRPEGLTFSIQQVSDSPEKGSVYTPYSVSS